MSRARHEHQIKLHDTTFGGEFDEALSRVISRNRGLRWFTDEQIAEIRDDMIAHEWHRHQFRRDQRKQALARHAQEAGKIARVA